MEVCEGLRGEGGGGSPSLVYGQDANEYVPWTGPAVGAVPELVIPEAVHSPWG